MEIECPRSPMDADRVECRTSPLDADVVECRASPLDADVIECRASPLAGVDETTPNSGLPATAVAALVVERHSALLHLFGPLVSLRKAAGSCDESTVNGGIISSESTNCVRA